MILITGMGNKTKLRSLQAAQQQKKIFSAALEIYTFDILPYTFKNKLTQHRTHVKIRIKKKNPHIDCKEHRKTIKSALHV